MHETGEPHGTAAMGHATVNISATERWLSAVAGSGLVISGVLRGYRSGIALAGVGSVLVVRGVTGRSLLYRAVGLNRADGTYPTVQKSVTINRPADEVYRFWRNVENLPHFMTNLVSVKMLDAGRSHWVALAPLGRTIEWNADIVTDRPGEEIAWRSAPGSQLYSAGTVRFTPLSADRGTELHVTMEYNPPAGIAGALVAKLFGAEPNMAIEGDLRRLKNLLEAHEIPTTTGQSSARHDGSQ
ncbi:MAG: SRPBCC family protein [Herpetosiphon sp.]